MSLLPLAHAATLVSSCSYNLFRYSPPPPRYRIARGTFHLAVLSRASTCSRFLRRLLLRLNATFNQLSFTGVLARSRRHTTQRSPPNPASRYESVQNNVTVPVAIQRSTHPAGNLHSPWLQQRTQRVWMHKRKSCGGEMCRHSLQRQS